MARRMQAKTTSARRFTEKEKSLLQSLKTATEALSDTEWQIGETVNLLKSMGVKIYQQAEYVKFSRQRLSEYRRTAEAFPSECRREGICFDFHNKARCAAVPQGVKPEDVVEMIAKKGARTVREASALVAAWKRERDAAGVFPWVEQAVMRMPDLWRTCHPKDFRDCFRKFEERSVKLVIADPPYGAYGKNTSGNPLGSSDRLVICDGMDDESARALHRDLFIMSLPLMRPGGCLVLCRPGGHVDPPWLITMALEAGWECKHACGWRRGSPKLGNGSSPYTTGTERLLVFCRVGDHLQNHDGSSRDDIFDVPQARRRGDDPKRHAFGKPVELMARLINKHSFPHETVVEPFGGSGPVSRAAIRLGRTWMYCESNYDNYRIGSGLITEELGYVKKKATG